MTRGTLTRWLLLSCFAVGVTVGCSGSSKPAKNADDADTASEEIGGEGAKPKVEDEGWNDVDQKDVSSEQKGARKQDGSSSSSTSSSVKDNPEPEFKEGGSVDEAIKAVPQGLPRENLELDELNKPLNDLEIYAPCKLSPSSHFEIKFAVWAGRCVGMDIKTTPKNPKLESCLREVVSQAKWRDKTKSLNISTVSF